MNQARFRRLARLEKRAQAYIERSRQVNAEMTNPSASSRSSLSPTLSSSCSTGIPKLTSHCSMAGTLGEAAAGSARSLNQIRPDGSVLSQTAYSPFSLRFRSRTPGPPPFSSMNSMPLFSSADRILCTVSSRPPS
jgi:hypothetical protein